MLSLNATQLAIVASDYKKVSWLFTVVDSADPTTYYWSTITRNYGNHDYVYKIDPKSFNGVTLNRASSEINIQAPNDLSFIIENSGNTLTASNFIGGTVTLNLVIADQPILDYVTDEFGSYYTDGFGNKWGGEEVNEEIICTWKFNIKRCEAVYQTLKFTCEDFIQQYLEGDYPNTQLIKDINPSTDPDIDDGICVPRPIGTCYIPLRTLYITDQRYYLLGLTSAGTYTITKVRSPRSWGAGKSEWDSGSYTFTQSTKTIDAVNWRVFQAIIADSDGDGSADANGLWRQGDYFLDMPTKFSCSDTSAKTNPADAIEFILEDMGIASADIDTGVGSSFGTAATTFTSWGLTFNGAFYRKQSREQILAMLLNSCHSTLQITDKIELHVLSKISQKTITKADVLRMVVAGAGTFKYSLITEKQSDSGYIGFQIADESQDEFIKKLVPAKASTDHISSEVLDISFVQDTQDVQRVGTLYYQRKFLKKANISFSNKGSTLLALQPDDIITINHADYGGNYPVLIGSMTIKRDLSIDFNCIQFSETFDDWTDLTPAVITPEVDDSGIIFNSAGNRIFSVQPYPPYDVGDLWAGGPSGDIKRCVTARTSGAYQAGDWGLASNYDNTGTVIENASASKLTNWNLTIPDVDEMPAGIYPVHGITDFAQVDFLDSSKDSIKILSTPDVSVAYGFPAIPIDDKNKYTVVIRHKSNAASTDGLYLRYCQYNAALPVGKTHIGYAGSGANTQIRTNVVDLVADGPMPGTSWTVDTYTYTPTAGTKYASFSMYNWEPNTAGVEYHIDYVLMYVSYKKADNTDHTNDATNDSTYYLNIDGSLNINGGGYANFKSNSDVTLGQIGGIGAAAIFKIEGMSGYEVRLASVNAVLALLAGNSEISTEGKIVPGDLTAPDFGSTTNPWANAFTNTVATRQALAISGNSNGSMIIGITNTDAARTVTLRTADCISGKIIIIKDESGGAGTHNITIATEGAETIDGLATGAIAANHGNRAIYSDGSNWFYFAIT